MSDRIVGQFLAQSEMIRSKYLSANNNDVEKAAAAFHKDTESKKINTYYAGGSKSGVAVIAPGGEDGVLPDAPPKPAVNVFAGSGHTLGQAAPPPAQPQQGARTDYTTPGAPKTRVRFTFADNSNLMLSVNLAATIADLKTYVTENRPDAAGKPLTFLLTPMNTPLDDDTLTVEAGKLKMATIICNY
ncbi:hypothetical protein TRFO_33037 [Tritrichomonas foetus]|uniref:UBX domain-containing protein n=1 Tax=Tritrichomonas foetus TaxID=1144522 RepID=A0A1J4JRY2_9EUKA|nr:hypothetical protein TRFO_33037 [Tritrichomonas foetus]|eukprot:OHT00286.1 hypothetical protein TRFO_33037 [Tritrichomonas foetus]